jgi:hypothetical protein
MSGDCDRQTTRFPIKLCERTRAKLGRLKRPGKPVQWNRNYLEMAIPQWLGSVRKAKCVPSLDAAVF